MKKLSKREQETIILFDASTTHAEVYTASKVVMDKFDSLVNEFPETYKCIKVTDISKTYSMPKQYINYCKPRKISDERKEQMRMQISKINNRRSDK